MEAEKRLGVNSLFSSSLFLVPCSLFVFVVPCSLFLVPCSLFIFLLVFPLSRLLAESKQESGTGKNR